MEKQKLLLLNIKDKTPQIKEFFQNRRNIKVRFVLVCLTGQMLFDDWKPMEATDKAYFHSETYTNLEATDVEEIPFKMIKEILNGIANFQLKGSGWYFKEVLSLEIHTVDHKPMKGSSYIPLPDFITKKKAILNMLNKDEKCFLWSVLGYLHPGR